MAQYLQPRFFKEKRKKKTAPFTNQLTEEEVNTIMTRAMKQTDRYRIMKEAGCPEAEIKKAFNTKYEMSVFSYVVTMDARSHLSMSALRDAPDHRERNRSP